MDLNINFNKFAQVIGASDPGVTGHVQRISTDTRTLQRGDVFFALQGESFDAETLIDQAIEKGASAIVARSVLTSALPVFTVADARIALGHLARFHRARFTLPLIAITGSCGKTTTRGILGTILTQHANTHHSLSSFNNDIGLPLTLLNLHAAHRYSVVEVGTNHFGEIAYLTAIAKPTVAVITTIAPVHVEFLRDTAGVARAKAELFQGLTHDGSAILPADSEFLTYFQRLLPTQRIITFGQHEQADFRVTQVQFTRQGTTEFVLQTPDGQVAIQLPLLGLHNALNAAAAAAAAWAVGIAVKDLPDNLLKVAPEAKRMQIYPLKNNSCLIDDSYNANLIAVKAAIDVLKQQPYANTLLILGDMGEIGDQKINFHLEIGRYAQERGIQKLLACGVMSEHTVQAFGQQGHHFLQQPDLIQALPQHLCAEQAVLVKGSLSAKMARVVTALLDSNLSTQ